MRAVFTVSACIVYILLRSVYNHVCSISSRVCIVYIHMCSDQLGVPGRTLPIQLFQQLVNTVRLDCLVSSRQFVSGQISLLAVN